MKKTHLLIVILSIFCITSCEVVQQLEKVYYLKNCEFCMKNVNNFEIAGISLNNISNPNQFSIMDASKLLLAAKSSNFPLTFNLNIEGNNPNTKEAGLTKMDYILLIDDVQMTSGTTNQAISIPANGIATIPFKMNVNLKEIFKGQTVDAIVKFAKNLAGIESDDSRVTMKVKPYVTVNNTEIATPEYITLSKSFKSN